MRIDPAALGGVPYLVFLAPGLLAATAMQTAAFEATFPIMGGLVWSRIFHAMYATPISPRDIALGNLAWIAARLTLISIGVHDRDRPVRGSSVAPDRARDPGRGPDRHGVRGADRGVLRDPEDHRTSSPRSSGSGSRRCSCSPARSSRSTRSRRRSRPSRGSRRSTTASRLTRAFALGMAFEDPLLTRDEHPRPGGVHRGRDLGRDPDRHDPAGRVMTALRLTPTFLIGSRRSLRLIERNIYVYRHGWIIILSGFFEPLFYLLGIGFGLGALIGTVPGPDGQPISYHPLRGARAPRELGDERGDQREHVQLLLQAQLQQDLHVDPRDAAVAGRHRPRRARLGAHPRRPVRHRLHGRDGRPGPGRLAVGDPRVPGGTARRLRVRGRRDGRDVVHEDAGRTSTSSSS